MTTETTTKRHNPFEYLDTVEEQRDYLQAAWEHDDDAIFTTAVGHMVRHFGVASIAKAMGVSRTSLYKSFNGKAQPGFSTVKKVLKVTDMKVQFAATT